jgi:hypothetical protein
LDYGCGAKLVSDMGNEMRQKFEVETRPFCFCGRLATQVINGVNFCKKHKKLKEEVQKIGRYSGKSKSEFKYNDYK